MDLDDLEHNTRDGVHIAALAGSWLALVAGFGGLRDHDEVLLFRPQLPTTWRGLTFTIRVRGSRLRVQIAAGTASYSVLDGEPVRFRHVSVGVDETITLAAGQTSSQPWSPVQPLTATPHQPAGRQPLLMMSEPPAR
jgi:alpha,alpha-trehalose phosphorylase